MRDWAAHDRHPCCHVLSCGRSVRPTLYASMALKPGVAARRAAELPARQVANIVHGFAAMGHHPGSALLAACALQAAERVAEAAPQNLANTAWGFAKLQFNPGDALLRAYEAAAQRRAEDFKPQNVVRVESLKHILHIVNRKQNPIC